MTAVCVVRSNGERTADMCVDLLSREIDVQRIAVKPFTEALRECFRLGIESGAEWMLTVDADILPHPGSVTRMLEIAKDMDRKVFHFQGRVHCKLFMGERKAGQRMYRVKHLPGISRLVEPDIRPESLAIKRYMRGKRLRSLQLDEVFGLHDHEQWLRDIHRKAGVHREKHSCWGLLDTWLASSDPDLQAAAQGWLGEPLSLPEKGPLCLPY